MHGLELATAHAKHLVVEVTYLGSRPILMKLNMRHIYLCEYNSEIFVKNLFQSTIAMTSVCQKSICIYQDCRNKGFMPLIKEVWD